jgi:uridylate kinase
MYLSKAAGHRIGMKAFNLNAQFLQHNFKKLALLPIPSMP